jgi:hypothetical protein
VRYGRLAIRRQRVKHVQPKLVEWVDSIVFVFSSDLEDDTVEPWFGTSVTKNCG